MTALRLGLGFGPYSRGLVAVAGAPIFTSTDTRSVPENTTLAHTLSTNEPATFAIRTAAQNALSVDHLLFTLVGSTIGFASGTKDYEAPDDTGTNNTYVVVVRATDVDEGLTTDQTITFTVTDVAEGGAPEAGLLDFSEAEQSGLLVVLEDF